MTADLRLGRWQDVLADVERCDVIITDPPYSARTHDGQRSAQAFAGHGDTGDGPRTAIDYSAISPDLVHEFVVRWAPVTRRWAVMFGDHFSWRWWYDAWANVGWYVFGPVPWVKTNANPRFRGDGPASSSEYLCIARPRGGEIDIRSRPGHYIVQTGEATGVIGTKDVDGLVRVVLDYTRPGDLVVDPFAGTATVAAACLRQGRRYIGSEMDPETHAKGMARIEATQQDPVVRDRWAMAKRQGDLFT